MLSLENTICSQGHLCSTTVLHIMLFCHTFDLYQAIAASAIWILHLSFSEFNNVLVNCAAPLITKDLHEDIQISPHQTIN